MPNATVSTTDAEAFVALSTGGLDELKKADCVVVVGADLIKESQVAGFFIKRNLPLGTSMILIDSHENGLKNLTNFFLKVEAGARSQLLDAIGATLVGLGANKAGGKNDFVSPVVDLDAAGLKTGISKETILTVARRLAQSEKIVIIYGAGVANNGSRQALETLSQICGAAAVLNLQSKANSRAAASLGLPGLTTQQAAPVAYLALGDDTPSDSLVEALQPVTFLAIQAAYRSALTERADVILPVEIWTEQAGHFMNVVGHLQAVQPCITPIEGALSNEAVLRQLAGKLGVSLSSDWQADLNQAESTLIGAF